MTRVHRSDRRPAWWGPDWLGFPAAFWLSIATSAAATFVLLEVLLRVLFPSLFRPHEDYETLLAAGDYYAALACGLGALPTAQMWKRALHRRGVHSWSD